MTPFSFSDRPIDQFLADAIQAHSLRTQGKRAKRMTVVYEDDTMTILPLSGEATAQRTPPSADHCTWPPNEGWAFRPGEAAFDGTRFKLIGKPLAILAELAHVPGAPVTVDNLKRIVWHEEPEHVEDSSLQAHLSQLRKKLREVFGLEKDLDPIPNVGGAYKLAIY